MALRSALIEKYDTDSRSDFFDDSKATIDSKPGQGPTRTISIEEFEQLRHQATRLEHLLQVMPAGVLVVNGQGIVKQANAVAKELLGEPLEEQLWRTIISRSFKPQADDGHEVSLHDGRKVKLSITPLLNEPGQLIVLTDLTETRILQKRISHMQRLSALGKTVASVVHQIRTPLSAAMLYAANLTNTNLTATARESFSNKLKLRLHELESQVNDMLLFAKSGEQQVVEPISINELLDEIVSASDGMLNQANGNLTLRTAQDAVLIGNRPALIGAIQNVLHNAIQVQPVEPQIRIIVTQTTSHILLAIEDDGPGIAEQHIKQIFTPFFTTKSHGTGLGLAVVNTVAKSHGGQVGVENLPQGGARFTLSLPKQSTAPRRASPFDQSKQKQAEVGEQS